MSSIRGTVYSKYGVNLHQDGELPSDVKPRLRLTAEVRQNNQLYIAELWETRNPLSAGILYRSAGSTDGAYLDPREFSPEFYRTVAELSLGLLRQAVAPRSVRMADLTMGR